MLPVFAGYVAYSIAEKPGLVAGFVAGAIAKEGYAFGKIPYAQGGEATSALAGVSSGFLGALVGGFIAGALVLLVKKYVRFLVHLKVPNQSFSCHFLEQS